MGKFDAAIKHAVTEYPQDWADFLEGQRGVPARLIDSDLAAVSYLGDKVFWIDDPDEPYVTHLEPHSYYDPDLDVRCYSYHGLLIRRHRVFPRIVVLLLDRRAWEPNNHGYVRGKSKHGDCSTDFKYDIIRIWEIPAADILKAGVGVLPLAPIADAAREELPQVIEKMEERIAKEVPPAEAGELWTATYLLVGLKYDEGLARTLLQKAMSIMQESSTFQAIMNEGRQAEKIASRREILLQLGRKEIGEPTTDILAAIDQISDAEHLTELVLRAPDVETWEELLDITPSNEENS